jgi:hypothetical protein
MPPLPPDRPTTPRQIPAELLPFKPWMLALAVFTACALGVAIMEDLRSPRDLWAQNGAASRR